MTGIPAGLRDALAERYPIERQLGRGGMATVYLARDVKHYRQVALKVLHPELAAGLGAERFLREIRIEAGLQHPNILPLHDSGEVGGYLYYVMPYVSGESLRGRIARHGPLPVPEALRIAEEVADALGHAHERGVVHRDIKPENILLSGGHALVADFGIAKAVEAAGDARLTETGWGMGTPAYMSPEQILGEAVDGRSDLYALSCVLFEMLAGEPPFVGGNARAVFTRHQTEPARSLRVVRPDVPFHIDQAVRTGLAKRSEDRFATAPQFMGALRTPGVELPAGDRVTDDSVGAAGGRAPRWSRRTLIALAGAGLLAIGGYLTGFRADPGPARAGDAASVAVLPIEDIGGGPPQAYVADGMTEELITSLARIKALRVINRQTMMAYRGSSRPPGEIARELAVDAVVAATMQRLGDTVHLTAQLTMAGEDRALWAASYDGSRADLLRLQRVVARDVGARIRGKLADAEVASLTSAREVDPDAVDRYIRARHVWNKRGRTNLLQAIDLFGEALDLDPTYAPAYSGMASAYVQLGYGSLLAPDDAFPKAGAAARKALELDSTLAEPHAVLGFVHLYYDWDWAAADSQFRISLRLNPSDATAHEWYGLFLAAMGRFGEAQAEEGRAQELDPLSVPVAGTAGWVLHYSGRQDEAARQLRIALRADSTFPLGRLYLARVHQAEGRLDSAVSYYRTVGPLSAWVPTFAGLGHLYGEMGRRREALEQRAILDSLSGREYVTAYGVALVHAGLGDADSAIIWLDRGVAERTHWLVWLNRDRRWDPLRSDPRFQSLVRRVGLPP